MNKKGAGRPSKCSPELCEELIKFFNIEPTRTIIKKLRYKNGDVKEEEVDVANDMVFFSEFERKFGLGIGRCSKWYKARDKKGKYKYLKFRQAYKEAKALQKNMLIKLALKGLYQGAFSIFAAKNIIGWRYKTETDITSGGEKISGMIIEKEK